MKVKEYIRGKTGKFADFFQNWEQKRAREQVEVVQEKCSGLLLNKDILKFRKTNPHIFGKMNYVHEKFGYSFEEIAEEASLSGVAASKLVGLGEQGPNHPYLLAYLQLEDSSIKEITKKEFNKKYKIDSQNPGRPFCYRNETFIIGLHTKWGGAYIDQIKKLFTFELPKYKEISKKYKFIVVWHCEAKGDHDSFVKNIEKFENKNILFIHLDDFTSNSLL